MSNDSAGPLVTDADLRDDALVRWHDAEDVLDKLGADLTWEQEKQATLPITHDERMKLGAALMAMGTLFMLLETRQAELERVRGLAVAGLEGAKLPQSFQPFYAIWPGGVIDHNAAIDAVIAEIKGVGGNG